MSHDPIPTTPAALARILARRPILWVGAGASIAAGHPSTRALVDALVDAADDPIDPALPFEQVADAFVASQGEGDLGDLLQRVLGGSPPLTELHRALARKAADGAFAAIVTTNYDDLLERALGEAEARFVFQSLEENAVVVDPAADVRLLKLHGSRVAASLHSLAVVLQAQGDLAGARETHARVLDMHETIYGKRDHYLTAIVETNLGLLLFELDGKEAGVELLAHAYGPEKIQTPKGVS